MAVAKNSIICCYY